jgi:hypothetical protein
MTFLATAAFALLILTAHQSYAQDPQVERGRAFAQSQLRKLPRNRNERR